MSGPRILFRKEHYDAGIYIRDIENVVAYSTDNYQQTEDTNVEEINNENKNNNKNQNRNQILFSNNKNKKE